MAAKKPPEIGQPVETSALEKGGFALEFDPKVPILHARLWGFWDLNVAGRFRTDLLAACLPLRGKTWSALVDSRTFLTQSPAVTQHRRETMVLIMSKGCWRIGAVVSENGTYAMQFMRIASEAGVTSEVFLDPVLALKWVREA